MPVLSDRAQAAFTGLLRGVLSVVALPIREAHLVIGHSTVTAALLLSLSLFGVGWLWTASRESIEGPAFDALRAEREARAALYGHQIAQEGGTARSSSWQIGALSATAEGVTLAYSPLPGAAQLLLSWRIPGTSAGGLLLFDIPAEGGVIAEVGITADQIGPGWQSGRSVSVEADQLWPDGHRARFTAGGRSVRIP